MSIRLCMLSPGSWEGSGLGTQLEASGSGRLSPHLLICRYGVTLEPKPVVSVRSNLSHAVVAQRPNHPFRTALSTEGIGIKRHAWEVKVHWSQVLLGTPLESRPIIPGILGPAGRHTQLAGSRCPGGRCLGANCSRPTPTDQFELHTDEGPMATEHSSKQPRGVACGRQWGGRGNTPSRPILQPLGIISSNSLSPERDSPQSRPLRVLSGCQGVIRRGRRDGTLALLGVGVCWLVVGRIGKKVAFAQWPRDNQPQLATSVLLCLSPASHSFFKLGALTLPWLWWPNLFNLFSHFGNQLRWFDQFVDSHSGPPLS